MSDRDNEKLPPSHRVSFARLNGRDRDGNETLGPAREIGSIWPRRGREGEGILRFDHIPEEMRSQGGGVLFVRALDREDASAENPARRPFSRNKDRDQDRDR